MKTHVISYSLTGNNEKLAKKIANALQADFSAIEEKNDRNYFTIVLDILLNRTPTLKNIKIPLEHYDHIIFVAPVWLGKIATPLRALLKQLKGKAKEYSFVSISAGADGKENPNLEKELTKRTGITPDFVINLLISNILRDTPKPTGKQLDEFRLSDADAGILAETVLKRINGIAD